jgi:PTH1 family peptidyl-tRNA hydrolase
MCAFRRVRDSLRGLVGRPAPVDVSGPATLVVGLGNPGPQYARHRHNLGFMALDRFAERHGFRFGRREANALVAVGSFEGASVVLGKPQTFMNLSGSPVRALIRRYARGPDDLVVIYDDLDLPLGRLRVRKDGSHGGHNGMRDVIGALGGAQFPRLRLGIGRPPSGEDPVEHVLRPFTPDERPVVEAMLDDAVAALEHLLREGTDSAMNVFNRDRRTADPPSPASEGTAGSARPAAGRRSPSAAIAAERSPSTGDLDRTGA